MIFGRGKPARALSFNVGGETDAHFLVWVKEATYATSSLPLLCKKESFQPIRNDGAAYYYYYYFLFFLIFLLLFSS